MHDASTPHYTVGGNSMRFNLWMALSFGALALGSLVRPALAQPGHAPFVFAPLEIDNFERALAPAGIPGATIVNPATNNGTPQPALNHPAVTANGGMAAPYVTGAPLFLEEAHSAIEIFGGILGHTPATGNVTTTNYNDLFPGGVSIAPGGYPNGGNTNNFPSAFATDSYNGTKISLVTKNDANTADDDAVTSGNQALRVSMWNVGHGDGNTSFDRPAMLTIKERDFWGVTDSRFQTWEAVRAAPGDYSVSIDVTILADEIPDESASGFGPYLRLGFISGHGGNFDEGPPSLLQGPDALAFSNADADGDGLPNFSDPQWVDPGNPANLPGAGKPGVIQRRYAFPADAMTFPAAPLTGLTDQGNDENNGGSQNAYMFGFVWNGIWRLTDATNNKGVFSPPASAGGFDQFPASFIIDNIRFIDRFSTASADFNLDGFVNAADWQILRSNLNSLTANTFAQGDIGSAVSGEEIAVSPGVVDFQDFIRFEEIYNKKHGGDGAFQRLLAGVPEPASAALLLVGCAALACLRRRSPKALAGMLVAAAMACSATNASAALQDALLFSFEPGSTPDAFQRWDSNTVADNTVVPADADTDPDDIVLLATNATGATNGTQALSITQRIPATSGTPINGAFVSIFGSESGLPDQQAAVDRALNIGANNFELWLDVTYRDAEIPPTSSIALSVGLSVGSDTSDRVDGLALAGDGGGGVPNGTQTVKIPLGLAPVVAGDGTLQVTNQAGGSYNLTIGLDGDWTANATVHIDNIILKQISQPPLLTLEINQGSGLATIKNTPGVDSGTGPVVFDYYEIESVVADQTADFNGNGTVDAADYTVWRNNLGLMDTATQATGDANGDGDVTAADYTAWKSAFGEASGGNGTSLNPAGWNSHDDQNVDPNGVDVVNNLAEGSPSSTILTEARLIGSSTWDNAETRPIGNIYTPGAPHNLVFRYRDPARKNFLVQGLVTYVGAGGGSAVPEPGSLVLLLTACVAACAQRRFVKR
jgi:hypothetical protein